MGQFGEQNEYSALNVLTISNIFQSFHFQKVTLPFKNMWMGHWVLNKSVTCFLGKGINCYLGVPSYMAIMADMQRMEEIYTNFTSKHTQLSTLTWLRSQNTYFFYWGGEVRSALEVKCEIKSAFKTTTKTDGKKSLFSLPYMCLLFCVTSTAPQNVK